MNGVLKINQTNVGCATEEQHDGKKDDFLSGRVTPST